LRDRAFCGTDRNNPHQKPRRRKEQIPSYLTELRRRSTTRRTGTFPDCLPASPLAWVHAFAKQGAALSASPLRSESLPTPAAYRCACCDESQPAWPGTRQPRGTHASLQQTSFPATTPSRAMTLLPRIRNEQPHWTTPAFCVRNHGRAYRIQLRVAQGLPEVGFVLRARIVPALPNVTATAMRRVPVGSITSVRILQSCSQNVCLLGSSNKVNMVRHQTIANQFYLVTLRAPAQQVEVEAAGALSRPRRLSS
jgi:hypothetical protein